MHFTPRLQQLLSALRCLPGVGPKSAQRMAFHLLDRDRDRANELVQALQSALDEVGHCRSCRMFAEQALCPICADKKRDTGILCVVETRPEELGIDLLDSRLAEEHIDELILATSATVEGEATASYIAALAAQRGIRATRIAHGVPMGGELEYIDSSTLSLAISARTSIEAD